MTVVRFEALAIVQLAWVANGCGPGMFAFLVPNLIFAAACDRHDFDYWSGFTERHRRAADWRFLQNMLKAVSTQPWWRRWFYKAAAWRYWSAVRIFGNRSLFGKTPFHYRSGFGTHEEMAMEMGMGTRPESERRLAAAHKLHWVPKQPKKAA